MLLRYAAREVEVVPLVPDPDPNLVDLCAEHADRLTPPIGWSLRDSRAGLPASA